MLSRDNTKITSFNSEIQTFSHPSPSQGWARGTSHTPCPRLSRLCSVPLAPSPAQLWVCKPTSLIWGRSPRAKCHHEKSFGIHPKPKQTGLAPARTPHPLNSLQARSAADKTVSGFINVTKQVQNCFCLHRLEGRRGCCAHLTWPPVLHKPRELTRIYSR